MIEETDPMTPPAPATDDPLHEEIRATLERHAGDVDPQAPDWDSLVERSGPAVVSLRTGGRIGAQPRWGDRRRWARPTLAAAACLAVVAAAAVVVNVVDEAPGTRTGPSDRGSAAQPSLSDPADPTDPTDPTGPAPGAGDFDPAAVDPLYPADNYQDPGGIGRDRAPQHGDPRTLAEAYLADRLGGTTLEVGEPEGAAPASSGADAGAAGGAGETVTVRWTAGAGASGGDGGVARGTVVLVQDTGREASWSVVGATTDGLRLADVHRDGGQLSFAIDRRDDQRDGEVAVSVLLTRPTGEAPVAVPGGEEVSSGVWLVDAPPGERLPVMVPVGEVNGVRVVVGHFADGRWVSLSEVAPAAPAGTGADGCGVACPDPR